MTTIKTFFNKYSFKKFTDNLAKEVRDFFYGDIECIKRFVKPGRNVLEVGCGYGRLLFPLSEKSSKVVGIDFSKKELSQAKRNFRKIKNVKFYYMNATKIHFGKLKFDYVLLMNNALGNMPGIEKKVIGQMIKAAKNGGRIFIRVFSEKAKTAQLKNYKKLGMKGIINLGNAYKTKEGFYSRRFTISEINELFEGYKLKPKIINSGKIGYLIIAIKKGN